MMLDVYVGIYQSAGDLVGQPMQRQSEFFPGGYSAFFELRQRMQSGVYATRQLEWGRSWEARVTRQQILDFMRDYYATAKVQPHELNDLEALVAFVDALDPDGEYALIARES